MFELEMTPAEHRIYGCPIGLLQKATGGKWKLFILWGLSQRTMRFGELSRMLESITQSQLTKALRELEQDGFVDRYVFHEIPLKVEYSLTALGQSFVPILEEMYKWGRQHLIDADMQDMNTKHQVIQLQLQVQN